jgi:4-diphosphocytidyl-2C-methyl-D-erythritol kinase
LTSSLKISSIGRFEPTLEGNLVKEVETWVRAGNDLEPYARTLCPAIGEIRDSLEAAGAVAAMTGSGSAVFGVFRSPMTLAGAEASVARLGLKAMRCVPIGREEYSGHTGLT